MKAIETKFFGPTDKKGSRIKASCEAGSVTVGYDHALDSEGNHRKAAEALCVKLGWCNLGPSCSFDNLHSGYLKKCTHVHVLSRL